MRPTALILFFLLLSWRTAAAQPAVWLDPRSGPGDDKIYIVTTAHPKRKQLCHIVSVGAADVSCSRHFGRKPRVFTQADVVALIKPGHRGKPNWGFAAFELAGVGIITGAVLLGPLAFPLGIFLAVPTGLLGVSVMGLGGMLLDDGSQPTRTREWLIYLAPGQQLQVVLAQ